MPGLRRMVCGLRVRLHESRVSIIHPPREVDIHTIRLYSLLLIMASLLSFAAILAQILPRIARGTQ